MLEEIQTQQPTLPRVAVKRQFQIIVVEDDSVDAEVIMRHLNILPSPFNVYNAQSIARAQQLLTVLQVDAIVLDLHIEDSKGIETFMRVRSIAKDIPIVVLSGTHDLRLRAAVRTHGADDVLSKADGGIHLLSRSLLYVIEQNRAKILHYHLESLLKTTPDAIMVINLAGVVRYVNEATLRLFGRTREEFLGELLGFSVKDGEPAEISIPRVDGVRVCEMRVVRFEWRDEPAYLAAIRDLTALKTSQREATEKAQLAQQRSTLLQGMLEEIAAVAHRIGLDNVANAHSLIIQSISNNTFSEELFSDFLKPLEIAFSGYVDTNHKLAQQNHELEQAKASIEVANLELESFSHSVAHDLRGPLMVINAYCNALQRDSGVKNSDGGMDQLQKIQHMVTRMNRIIEDLLALSRLSGQEVKRSTVNLSQLARDVFSRINQSSVHSIELIVEEDMYCVADPGMIETVLENLLGNAIKYSSKQLKPRIEFSRLVTGEGNSYYIRDNGVGFDPLQKDKLFQAFKRLHSSSEFEGNGVGLSIVKRIIDRHGGELWAESAVGQGAAFYFSLKENSLQVEESKHVEPSEPSVV